MKVSSKQRGSLPSFEKINTALSSTAQPVLEERARAFIARMKKQAKLSGREDLISAVETLQMVNTPEGIQVQAGPGAYETIRKHEFGSQTQNAFPILRSTQKEEESLTPKLRADLKSTGQRALKKIVRS